MSILYEFTNSLKTEKAQFRWTDQSFQVLKAGTPLDANGAIANDATAVGIVAYDVPPSGGSMWSVVTNDGSYYADVELITSGYIDEAAAEASCGLEYTDALKGALSDIVFVDGEIGSGGGGEPTERVERTVYIPEQTAELVTPESADPYYPLIVDEELPETFTLFFNGFGANTMVLDSNQGVWVGNGCVLVPPTNDETEYKLLIASQGRPEAVTVIGYTETTTYSGASIPDYTAEDEGKVLTLAENAQDASYSPVWSSMVSPFVVSKNIGTVSINYTVYDKTWTEAVEAFNSGAPIIINVVDSNGITRGFGSGIDETNRRLYYFTVPNGTTAVNVSRTYLLAGSDGDWLHSIPSGNV